MLTRSNIFWVSLLLSALLAWTPVCDARRRRGRERKDAVTSQSSGIVGLRKGGSERGVSENDVSEDSASSGQPAAAEDTGSAEKAKQCQDCIQAPVISIKISTRTGTTEDRRHQLLRRGRHRSRDYRHRARQHTLRLRHRARPLSGRSESLEGEDSGGARSIGSRDSSQLDKGPELSRHPSQTTTTLQASRPPQHQPRTPSHVHKQHDQHQRSDGESALDKDTGVQTTVVETDINNDKSSKSRKTSERGTAVNTNGNSETPKPSFSPTKPAHRKKSMRRGKKKKSGRKSSKRKSEKLSSSVVPTLRSTSLVHQQTPQTDLLSSDTRSVTERDRKTWNQSLEKTRTKDNPPLNPRSVLGTDKERVKTDVSNSGGDSRKKASRGLTRRRQNGARRSRGRKAHTSHDRERQESAEYDRKLQTVGGRQDDAERDKKTQTGGGHHRGRQDNAERDRKLQTGGEHHKGRQDEAERDRKPQTGGVHRRGRQDNAERDRKLQTGGKHHNGRQDEAERDRKPQTSGVHRRGRQDNAERDRKLQTGGEHHKGRQDEAERDRKPQSSGGGDRRRHGAEGRRDREGRPRGRHDGAGRHRESQTDAGHQKGRKAVEGRHSGRQNGGEVHDKVRGRQNVTEEQGGMRRDWGSRIGAERYYSARRYGAGRYRGARRYGAGRYRGAGRYTFDVPSRPAAADRLEQRLFPSVTSSARTLLRSMQRVLSALSSGVQAVKDDNDFIFNGTRYVIMLGVRQQLKDIAQTNDLVYDVVLKSSLLTKDIYLRAHQHRLTGPTTRSLTRPEISLPSLYEVTQAAYEEERLAKQTLRSVQALRRQRDQLEARLRQVREKFQDNFARNDLRTLVYYINSTSQRLSSELTYSTHAAYVKRNIVILYGSHDNLNVARELLYKASDSLATGTDNYRGNYRVIEDWRRQKNDDDGVGAPSSIRRQRRSVSSGHDQPFRELTAEERAHLQPIIDRMKRHATEQKRLAMEIERILRPAIERGRLITQQEDIAASAHLSALASRLDRDGKKLYSLLDSIRVLIGSEEELRWVTVPAACRDDEEDDAEGSGCLPEGSGELVLEGGEEEEGSALLPGTTTDDEDFVFVDEKERPRRRGPTSLANFGHQLSVYVDGVKLRSNDILQRGDQLYETTQALSKRWANVKRNYDTVERIHRDWKQTQKVMRNVTQFADDTSDLTAVFSEEVARSHDSIESRMAKAVAIAERKLAEAKARKAGGNTAGPEAELAASDDTAMLEAVEKVQTVRKERDVISSLRAVTPQSCGRASLQVMRLHSNISHLRQQVNTAKALLQSMQLSISKSGSGYLSIPVKQKPPTPSPHTPSLPPSRSLVTTVEVCVKTQDIDGPVLLVKGNNSATFSLSTDSRQMRVTVYDTDGNNLDTITSDVTMKEDTWYNVKVTRTGKKVLLRVTPRDATAEPVENDVTVSSMMYSQPTPLHVYVGGVADNEPFSVGSDTWRGCLGELYVNGRAISLLHKTSTGELPQLCTSQCLRYTDGSSLVFDGVGFLHFPASVLPMRRRMQSVHFRFRSRQSTAALLHLVNQRQRFMLRVVLADGALMIDSTTPTESITLRSQSNNYNDNVFHSLKIQYRDSTTYPEIDGIDGAFTIEKSRPHNLNKMADGVVVGAFVTESQAFEKSKYRPLMGCVQELEIDDKPLSMSQAVTSLGVFSGLCDSHTVWSGCVQFEEDSTGIELGALDHSATIVLLFSLTARGPLLTYAREGKFEAEITATEEGLQVTTEEDTLTIARPDDVIEDFSMLSITDDGKVVRYRAWGEEVETSYGGFWDARSDVEGVHDVQLGLPSDPASNTQLFGQIAQLMVGDRFIDLTSYSLQHKLASCERPLPDLVRSETVPEVTTPSSEDVESTCSRDIRC